jgi:hypothetical protein
MPRINRLIRKKDEGGGKLSLQQENWLVFGKMAAHITNPFPSKSAHDDTWRKHRVELSARYPWPGFRCRAYFVCDLKFDVPEEGWGSVQMLAALIEHKVLSPEECRLIEKDSTFMSSKSKPPLESFLDAGYSISTVESQLFRFRTYAAFHRYCGREELAKAFEDRMDAVVKRLATPKHEREPVEVTVEGYVKEQA